MFEHIPADQRRMGTTDDNDRLVVDFLGDTGDDPRRGKVLGFGTDADHVRSVFGDDGPYFLPYLSRRLPQLFQVGVESGAQNVRVLDVLRLGGEVGVVDLNLPVGVSADGPRKVA